MRIVAGEFKGRSIESPDEKTTRPTTDRVRESMFSSILSRTSDLSLDGITVLDAFGGSGALGFEAISRGALRCQFWEQDSDARAILEANGALWASTLVASPASPATCSTLSSAR